MTQAARERANRTLEKTFKAQVKKAGERRRTFTISTKNPDREGDRILYWETSEFMKNPIVLFNHDYWAPVARAVSVIERGDRLKSTAEFPPEGVSQESDEVLALLDAGVLNAASIGFQVLSPVVSNDFGGFDYGIELLEWSIVSVPANAEALVERAKAAGLDPSPVRRMRERSLRRCAGKPCPSTYTEGDLVEDLLSLSDAQVRELAGDIAGEVYRRVLTPLTGRLGP